MPAPLTIPSCEHTEEAKKEARECFRGVCPCCVLEAVRKYIRSTTKAIPTKDRDSAIRILAALNRAANRVFRPVDANLRPIMARLASGVTEHDCMLVINHQSKLWMSKRTGDFDGARYLRPETLFRASKFEAYLADATAKSHRRPLPHGPVRELVQQVAAAVNDGGELQSLQNRAIHLRGLVEQHSPNGTKPDYQLAHLFGKSLERVEKRLKETHAEQLHGSPMTK